MSGTYPSFLFGNFNEILKEFSLPISDGEVSFKLSDAAWYLPEPWQLVLRAVHGLRFSWAFCSFHSHTRVFSGPAVKGEVTIPHWIAPSPRFRAGDHGEEMLSARHALDVS